MKTAKLNISIELKSNCPYCDHECEILQDDKGVVLENNTLPHPDNFEFHDYCDNCDEEFTLKGVEYL